MKETEENLKKIIILKNWNLVTVTGKNCKSFLNGQLTGNILKLKKDEHILTSHCKPNGKILGIIRLFHYKNGLAYIIKKNIAKKQTKNLKKYSIFSKINIKIKKEITLLGFIGKQSCEKIKKYLKYIKKKTNKIFKIKKCTVIYFYKPKERFLIITNNKNLEKLKKYFKYKYTFNEDKWITEDIISGIPNINLKNINKFTPQDVNLEYINKAIDFNKGCYCGQEIITKIKNKKNKKNKMYFLIGKSKKTPQIGEKIEYKINKKEIYQTGNILESAKLDCKKIIIQIVLNKDYEKIKYFNIIEDKKSSLKIQKNKTLFFQRT